MEKICPKCGEAYMRHRDYAKRMVKRGGNDKQWIEVERIYCPRCKHVERVLPDFLKPHKQYDDRIIQLAVSNPDLFTWDLKYEDYPSSETIRLWCSQ